MKFTHQLLAVAALCSTSSIAVSASAQTYDITYGSTLTAQITTTPSTGTNKAITGISGTFMGAAITGIVTNPYSPATAYIYPDVGTVQPTNAYPAGHSGEQYYYSFDNLLVNGNTFDSAGLLFTTADDYVNLYNDNGYALIFSPVGANQPATTATAGDFSITQVSAVPEPATWAMMLVGFGMVGFGLRYRRKSQIARVSFA